MVETNLSQVVVSREVLIIITSMSITNGLQIMIY